MSVSPPPIREPWALDANGKLISIPWILWLQQLANFGQVEDQFSNVLTLVSTAEATSHTPVGFDDLSVLSYLANEQGSTTQPSNEVDGLALMSYTPSGSSVLSNDAEMMAWMSF